MEYSAESVRFLYAAYALMALGQALYVAFLARRWTRLDAELHRAKSGDV